MLKADELACIRARAKAVTKHPWHAVPDVLKQREVLIRTDIPLLLDHISELEAQIAAMRPLVDVASTFRAGDISDLTRLCLANAADAYREATGD